MPEIEFVVRAALAEETNNGWVWLQTPTQKVFDESLPSRSIIIIKRADCRRSIFVEVRKIDANFLRRYNGAGRIEITPDRDSIVIAEWYRIALGILGTTNQDNQTDTARLLVKKSRFQLLGSLRAACHHPDLVVRLGTRLGMLGTWLGVLGVWLGFFGARLVEGIPFIAGLGVLGGLAILAIWAGRGPPRS